MCGRFTPVAQRLLKNCSRSSGLDARFRIARGVPTPLRSVRARLGIVVERPWTGLTAGEALRQNHGAEMRPGSFTAEAVKSRHRVQPQRTHAPCWGGVGL